MAISRCDETDSWLGPHRAPLIGFVLPLVNGDLQAAEDVVQETMLRGWQHSTELKPEQAGSWLHAVARNIAISAYHRRRRARPREVPLEAGGVIRCTANCLSFWFPVTAGNGATPRAASTLTGTFGSIKRPDGSRQLTYNGKPLYTFRLDDVPGQARGNNFTDKFGGQTFRWHAATASGSTPAPSQPGSPSGYNYSYQGGSGGY